MWKSKKTLLLIILGIILVAGTLGGFAVASADDEETATPPAVRAGILERVAEIYERNTGTAIDAAELQKAFKEARDETRADIHERFLQKLVDEGIITQEQADEFRAWLDARPGALNDEFKQWLEDRPDIPGLFGSGKLGDMIPFKDGIHHGFGRPGCEGSGFGFGLFLPEKAD